MTRDYSMFSSPQSQTDAPERSSLQALGWSQFFASQIDAEALSATPPVRVMEVHRNGLQVVGETIDALVPPGPEATVGDWLLFDAELPSRSVVLDRQSLIKRRAPGPEREVQLIAANIDTIFVVTSCNQDFNVARLERYLALAFEAQMAPVILLTKLDTAEAPQDYISQAEAISSDVPVVALDARGQEPLARLAPWCKPGRTVAFVGSSGVGKSTLTNALAGSDAIATRGIREDDAKGRHTTTRRQLHQVPSGCLVLDTPGMRELQMTEAAAGIGALFADLEELTGACKFNDCAHESEPGCAVLAAVEAGEMEAARVKRWRKLLAEEAFNTATLAERRKKDRDFSKRVRKVIKAKER